MMTKYAMASFLLGLLLETSIPNLSIAASSSILPAHHPPVPQSSSAMYIDPKFHGHLHCPYAAKWLVDGPAKASRDLGLDSRGRKLRHDTDRRRSQEENAAAAAAVGRCDFTNAFSGQATCLEFRGAAWTEEAMIARCDEESGALDATKGCRDGEDGSVGGGDLAGWCVKGGEGEGGGVDEQVEATAMMISSMADCEGNRMACQTFVGGRFVPDGVCAQNDANGTNDNDIETNDNPFDGATTSNADDVTCALAPGAIGAAHQAAYSSGYLRSGCPDTPAENSPYMWPLKWAADYESHSMPAYTDEVVFHAKGRTFYALDKNWKRSDTIYQQGVLRTIGQSPCPEENIDPEFAEKGLLGCWKNQTDYMTTMLHLGNMMYFLSYHDNVTDALRPGETDASKIAECTSIDLAVIGNIRPDWFLDKRGDDTDVQYLGNQHVYYSDENRTSIPKLVKQWRKKDFASQYFVMSMMGNPPHRLENKTDNVPVEDTLHWPLILNIPGEGFGDDQLQVYRNHALLTDDDDDLFTLVERYEALGGVCGNARGADDEGGDIGPPVLEEEAYIPSDLEVDPNSWVSNEYTFSPVWQVPTQEMGDENDANAQDAASNADSSGKANTRVSDRLTVQSCHDTTANTIDLSFHFHDMASSSSTALLPWMAIGYRSSDVCSMTPLEGGSTPLVLVATPPNESAPSVYKTELPPEAKSMSSEAFASMYANMIPLKDVGGDDGVVYMDVVLESPLLADATGVARASSSSPFGGEDDVVSLHYRQSLDGDSTPEAMYLMYAIGMSSELGIHETRGCFELVSFPVCATDGEDTVQVEIDGGNGDGESEDGRDVDAAVSSTGMLAVDVLSALSSAIVAMAVFGRML